MTGIGLSNSSPVPFGLPANSSDSSVDVNRLEQGITAVRQTILGLQRPDGHWCAELEGDTILESEYVLLQTYLGRASDPKVRQCANYLLTKQDAAGGWTNYPGGPPDISVSVKAYLALKIAGQDPESEPMRRARQVILDLGGAETVNSFTRFYLALLGLVPYRFCPSVPPELVLLPTWFPINLYAMSSWTRTIVVPLSIVSALQPAIQLPPSCSIDELFRIHPSTMPLPPAARMTKPACSWANFFRLADRMLKLYQAYAPGTLRRHAIRKAERWMIDHFEGSDGLGAIFPPMVYTIIALKVLGYAENSAEFQWAEKQLEDLLIRDADSVRIQPCVSPVWDTAIGAIAASDAGVEPGTPELERAARWLLDKEIREPGDWIVRDRTGVEPSGWAFEYANKFYADLDDTAMVLMAVARSALGETQEAKEATERGIRFLFAMQGRDGGWAAFDKDITNRVLEHVPFADHNAMLDPSCPDITARVLELLGQLGHRRGKPPIDRAIDYLLASQEPEGCWYGRWGVNYIYGTWQVLLGLRSIGYDMRHPRIRKAVDWLCSVQQPSGGWGESCASYDDRSKMGQGEATASQTAWAVMALVAAGDAKRPETAQGIQFLLDTQRTDGTWDEPQFTGTGFPRVFYLRYHYYSLFFPAMALARYRAALGGCLDHQNGGTDATIPLTRPQSTVETGGGVRGSTG